MTSKNTRSRLEFISIKGAASGSSSSLKRIYSSSLVRKIKKGINNCTKARHTSASLNKRSWTRRTKFWLRIGGKNTSVCWTQNKRRSFSKRSMNQRSCASRQCSRSNRSTQGAKSGITHPCRCFRQSQGRGGTPQRRRVCKSVQSQRKWSPSRTASVSNTWAWSTRIISASTRAPGDGFTTSTIDQSTLIMSWMTMSRRWLIDYWPA